MLEVAHDEAGVRFDWTLATGDVPPILVDAVFASHVALLARATAEAARPIRIELARRPRHAQVLRAHFKCPIAFGATHDRIVFAAATLAIPLVSANRAAYEQLVPGLEAKLAVRRSLRRRRPVRIAIARTIGAGAPPSIAAVADRLHTSARTLQRQLGKARTTFGAQLEDVRHVAARQPARAHRAPAHRYRVSPRLRGAQLVRARVPLLGAHHHRCAGAPRAAERIPG